VYAFAQRRVAAESATPHSSESYLGFPSLKTRAGKRSDAGRVLPAAVSMRSPQGAYENCDWRWLPRVMHRDNEVPGVATTLMLAADKADSAGTWGLIGPTGDHLHRWRATLEELWQLKLDEVILLSRACSEALPRWDDDPVDSGAPSLERLRPRTAQAYQELADIEAAINRIETGSYGICIDCRQPMPDDWLVDEPQVSYCPECSLRLLSWLPWGSRPAAQAPRTSSVPEGTAVAQRARPRRDEARELAGVGG